MKLVFVSKAKTDTAMHTALNNNEQLNNTLFCKHSVLFGSVNLGQSRYAYNFSNLNLIWDKIFKNGPSKFVEDSL